ncbi:MAG: hypothetical protein ACRYFU_06145 [Janthinobacterium lividum]
MVTSTSLNSGKRLGREEHRDRRRSAYHEAGHAVVAFVYGFPPYRVTIVPDNSSKGMVRIRVPQWAYQIKDSLAKCIVFTLAGIEAQNHYSRNGMALFNGGADDSAEAGEKLNLLYELTDGVCGEFDEFEFFANCAVRQYWYAIDAFARRLLEQEVIEGQELDDLLWTTIRNNLFEYLPVPEHLFGGYGIVPDGCTGEASLGNPKP